MAAALAFSHSNLGLTAPNPSVGALVVKDGVIIGRGVTSAGGRPHAETQALFEAGEGAQGATLYVTLEPCSHQGKTSPCADAIVAAGIGRVVSALEDANPQVAGRGHARLREAGIEVVVGVGGAQARRLHLGHSLVVTAGRPLLTLKLAQTADGFAGAAPDHDDSGSNRSRVMKRDRFNELERDAGAKPLDTFAHPALEQPRLLITGAQANAFTHMQRTLHDATLIGSGTAQADDPLLTVRLPGMEGRKPLRVILDTRGGLSPTSRLAETAAEVPTLLLVGEAAPAAAIAALQAKKIEVARLACCKDGHIDLDAALKHLAQRGLTRIFCEGGPRLGSALILAGVADEVLLLTSGNPLGHAGLPALSPEARAALSTADLYSRAVPRLLGADQLVAYERKL